MRQVGWVKRSETWATTGGLPLQKSWLLGFALRASCANVTSTQPTTFRNTKSLSQETRFLGFEKEKNI